MSVIVNFFKHRRLGLSLKPKQYTHVIVISKSWKSALIPYFVGLSLLDRVAINIYTEKNKSRHHNELAESLFQTEHELINWRVILM